MARIAASMALATATMIALAGPVLAEDSQLLVGGAMSSRCPTENQKRLLEENSAAGAYAPASGIDQPVTLTPTSGSEKLTFPFAFDRSETTKTLTFSVDNPMPIAAKDLEVAFQGDLRRTDEKEVFPLTQTAQQAAIVPVIRGDGRLVSIYVCVDPGQPNVAAPGPYQGKIAWNTMSTQQGAPLVSAGEVPVEVTLQYTRWGLAWGVFVAAFLVGMIVKLANDAQRSSENQAQQPAGAGQQQGRSGSWLSKMIPATGSTLRGFVVGAVFAFGVGVATFWSGYYGNPSFVGDWTGDMPALFATVFAAVVAAHAGAGALSRRG
jgi:hypothetical protein